MFLRLGVTSFGGPIAHLGYFRTEFVGRRRWLTGILVAVGGAATAFAVWGRTTTIARPEPITQQAVSSAPEPEPARDVVATPASASAVSIVPPPAATPMPPSATSTSPVPRVTSKRPPRPPKANTATAATAPTAPKAEPSNAYDHF